MSALSDVIVEAFCGCCGQSSGFNEEPWCADCLAHVLTSGPWYKRTFFAQTGADCPWQV